MTAEQARFEMLKSLYIHLSKKLKDEYAEDQRYDSCIFDFNGLHNGAKVRGVDTTLKIKDMLLMEDDEIATQVVNQLTEKYIEQYGEV
jgi:hypothetical protein